MTNYCDLTTNILKWVKYPGVNSWVYFDKPDQPHKGFLRFNRGEARNCVVTDPELKPDLIKMINSLNPDKDVDTIVNYILKLEFQRRKKTPFWLKIPKLTEGVPDQTDEFYNRYISE